MPPAICINSHLKLNANGRILRIIIRIRIFYKGKQILNRVNMIVKFNIFNRYATIFIHIGMVFWLMAIFLQSHVQIMSFLFHHIITIFLYFVIRRIFRIKRVCFFNKLL